MRLRELSGIAPVRRLVPVPSRLPELLGLAGMGGAAVPVYDLAALLEGRAESDRARWLALCGSGADAIAFAFGTLDGYLRVAADGLFPPGPEGAARRHVAAISQAGDSLRSVLEVASLVALIRQRIGAPATRKEQ